MYQSALERIAVSDTKFASFPQPPLLHAIHANWLTTIEQRSRIRRPEEPSAQRAALQSKQWKRLHCQLKLSVHAGQRVVHLGW